MTLKGGGGFCEGGDVRLTVQKHGKPIRAGTHQLPASPGEWTVQSILSTIKPLKRILIQSVQDSGKDKTVQNLLARQS